MKIPMDQQNHKTSEPIASQNPSPYAPFYELPQNSVVSVEHPFIIKNIDKALEMLGGISKLKTLIEDGNRGKEAKLYLHPKDPMCKPIVSKNVTTNDIVLKITVPKRTGLKRRKGACGPYYERLEDDECLTTPLERQRTAAIARNTRYMLRNLRDNTKTYRVQPVGSIYQTHRFRGMPDFVFSTTNSPFMTKMRENILSFEYEKLKKFTFDMSKGPQINADLIPPPRWSHITVPFNYLYLQNPGAKQTVDHLGNVTLRNFQKAMPIQNQPVAYDVDSVPNGPADDLTPVASLEPAMQRLIEGARLLFEQRPIWTRRALRNNLSLTDWNTVGSNSAKYIFQYVGYIWASGPWRDALVKFGIDPRKDPSYRIYQTMMFMLDPGRYKYKESGPNGSGPAPTEPPSRESHVFDGKSVVVDGKVWQVCDITDTFLVSILSTGSPRDKCHIIGDGWFHNGTWAKAKMIMKAKIASILAGTPQNHAGYVRAVALVPDIVDESNGHLLHFAKKSVAAEEVRLASHIRAAARKSALDERNMSAYTQGEDKISQLENEGCVDEDEDMDEGIYASGDENSGIDEDPNFDANRYEERVNVPINPEADSRVAEVMKALGNRSQRAIAESRTRRSGQHKRL